MSNPAAVYLLSTFQNPTTATMSLERRKDIAAIARRYHVQIIEDDVYSLLASSPLPPVSTLAPELAWYLLGTAKSFSAGLKLAFVVAPSAAEAKRNFWPGVRATYWMASPISAAIMAHLIATGGDLKILAAVRAELAARHHMVTTALEHRPRASDPGCLHVWIPLGSGLSGATASAAILNHGVQVAASDSYAHEGWTPPQAIRIGIGNPSSGDVLARALETIVRSLDALQENTRPMETSSARF
jgi:DNA-binding transcriptional MocR family regulator